MATRLSQELLADALTRLSGWSEVDDRLRRKFVVDAVARQWMTAEIDELARSTGHPIRVAGTPDGLAVTLETPDVDGVSEVDIAVATRLNDLFATGADRHIPRPRTAPARVVVTRASSSDGDEHSWWRDSDEEEPVIGVPAASAGGVTTVPLPDTASDEPEPGVEPEQELGAGQGLGFNLRGAGDPEDHSGR